MSEANFFLVVCKLLFSDYYIERPGGSAEHHESPLCMGLLMDIVLNMYTMQVVGVTIVHFLSLLNECSLLYVFSLMAENELLVR